MTSLANWLSQNLFFFQLLSLVLSTFLFCAIIYLVVKIDYFSDKREYGWESWNVTKTYKKRVANFWSKIIKNISSQDPTLWKEAVKIAEETLAEILKAAGYRGAKMEELLKSFNSIKILGADELKQKRSEFFELYADDSIPVDLIKTKELLREYRNVFKNLGMLD